MGSGHTSRIDGRGVLGYLLRSSRVTGFYILLTATRPSAEQSMWSVGFTFISCLRGIFGLRFVLNE
jgi:hypothetical protein